MGLVPKNTVSRIKTQPQYIGDEKTIRELKRQANIEKLNHCTDSKDEFCVDEYDSPSEKKLEEYINPEAGQPIIEEEDVNGVKIPRIVTEYMNKDGDETELENMVFQPVYNTLSDGTKQILNIKEENTMLLNKFGTL